MRHLSRNLALSGPTLALLGAIATTGLSRAYPADVFTAGAPLQGPAVHTAVEVPSGSWSVSPQTGAAQFSFSIPVPPGRNGMAPQLALQYSSQNPLRGGIAAGWELPVPVIEVDTSTGILGEKFYKSSMAGGQRLVEVPEPLPNGPESEVKYYRVESGDADFVRYEHRGFGDQTVGSWRALHTNGDVFEFGLDATSRDEPLQPDGTVREGRWMLSKVTDPTGNEIDYSYRKITLLAQNSTLFSDVDMVLDEIEWGRNAGAGLESHAQVELTWGSVPTCTDSNVPIGAEFTYRNGVRTYRGAMRLVEIDIRSRASDTGSFTSRRQIDLEYDSSAEDCTQPRAPLRILSSISQKLWDPTGAEQQLPPISFGYDTPGSESPARDLSASGDALPPPLVSPTRLGDGARHLTPSAAPPGSDLSVPGSQPSVRSMLQDADGDGFLDALKLADQAELSCNVDTYLNTSGTFASAFTRSWQRRPWENDPEGPNLAERKEGCNLAYQIDRRTHPIDDPNSPCTSMAANYNASHLIDLDADGIPELVSALDSKPGSYFRPNDPMMPAPPACNASSQACLLAAGQPDRVACNVQPPTPWTLPLADNPGPGESGGCGCSSGCPGQGCVSENGGCSTTSCAGCDGPCGDTSLSGDVFSARSEISEDGVSVRYGWVFSGLVGQEQGAGATVGLNPTCRYYADTECSGRYWWHVSKYDAATKSWSAPSPLLAPVPLESARGTATAGEGPTMSSFQALADIDGDRCLDALYVAPGYLPGIHDQIQVFRGDCTGNLDGTPDHFCGEPGANHACDPDDEPYLWPLPPDNVSIAYSRSQPLPVPIPPAVERTRVLESQRTLTDINGDGLPDYVVATATTPNGTSREGVRVFFNTGAGFETTATILAEGTGGPNDIAYEDVVHTLSSERSVILSQEPVSKNIRYGWSQATLRPFDFDGDGRIDVAQLTPPEENSLKPWEPADDSVRVHVNVGDRFVPVPTTTQTDKWWPGLAHITLSTPDQWWVKTDVQDLNGDGLPDMVGVHEGTVPAACEGELDGTAGFAICSTSPYVYRDERDSIGQGMRLLRTIDNGRGATVEFEYGSSAQRTGDDPLVIMSNGRLPQPIWLVRTMTVTPAQGAEPAVSDFRYVKPIFNPDRHGQWGFRGFGGVSTWEPMNAGGARRRVYRRYAYQLDHSGRPLRTTVWDGDRLQALEETAWRQALIFGDDVETFFPINTRHYTCTSGGGFAGGMAGSASASSAGGAGSLDELSEEVTEDPYSPQASGGVLASGASGIEMSEAVGGQTQSMLGGALTEEDCIGYGVLRRTTRRFVAVTAESLSYSGIDPNLDLPTGGGVIPPASGRPIMYVQRGERLTDSIGPDPEIEVVPEDRGWVFGEKLLYTAGRYEVLPTDVRKVKATSTLWGGYELWGRTQTVYDSGGLALPEVSRVWQGETEYAETTRTFDAQTGNVLTVQEPSGLVTTTAYDSLQLYPVTITPMLSGANPPDLTVTYTHDVHTGLVTRQQGPAQPGKSTLPVVETDYDGEGRPTSVRRSFDSGNQYVTATVKTLTYFDHAGDPLPHRVHVEELINRSAQTWIRRDATHDGLGRPIDESVVIGTGAATTSYEYDPAGNLITVTVPSPDGTGTAEYVYEHDALGRVIFSHQPGTPGYWQFGYDGKVVTRELRVADDSGLLLDELGLPTVAQRTTLASDAFDRLRTVTEASSTGADATWSYVYDPNDNMRHIVDADQIATTMEHDFVGHREKVTRTDTRDTERTWQYDYDLAGNLVAEIMPFDGDELTIGDFTSTWVYDELGRLTSHRTASRGMTDTSRYFPARSGPGDLFTFHTYDESGHGSGVGRLTHVELPFGSIDYDYSVEGLVTQEDRQFTITPDGPSGPSLSDARSYQVSYNALGQPLRVTHADDNATPTVTRTTYDERGLPLYVNRLVDVNGSEQPTLLARVVRNTAGVPTTRYSDFDQGQAWTYDPLGRVISHDIRSCTASLVTPAASRTCAESGTTVGGEGIAYFDSGDVDTIQDPFTGATIEYAFDAQHQLLHADIDGSSLYQADIAYTPAGRIQTAEVTSSAPGAAVRNVSHEYSPADPPNDPPADPHAVRRLVDQTSQNTLGVLDYDPTGNLVHKTWSPAQSGDPQDHDFIYDGDNQLREAVSHEQGSDVNEVYFYDHTGQRMLAYTSADGATPARLRLWFGQTQIEYSVATTPIQQTKSDVFASLGAMPVARVHRGASTPPANAELDLLYSGVLGSLLTVVGTPSSPDPTNHALLARYSYGPFGELLASGADEAEQFHRLFNGKEHDELTSLSYYGYRFYDRLTLTWTQADPLYRFSPDMAWDEPRRANLYSFTLNNPLRYVDPDGRDSWWDRFTDWVLEVDNDYRVSERAEGAGKTVAGGAGFAVGAALCESGAGCGIGLSLMTASADVAGSGISQVISGKAQPTALGQAAGPAAQAVEETVVGGAALASPLAGGRRPIASGGGETAASKETASLGARAEEVHSALHPIAQKQRTTAVLRAGGKDIVAGGKRDLSPAQRAVLRPGEVAAKLHGAHAEVTALAHAKAGGLAPKALAVTRAICPRCAAAIEAVGGTLTSSTTATWPKK